MLVTRSTINAYLFGAAVATRTPGRHFFRFSTNISTNEFVYEFDRDTSVDMLEAPVEPAIHRCRNSFFSPLQVLLKSSEPLTGEWSIAGAPNGGLLVGMAINSMRKAIRAAGGEHHDPLTISCHFLSKSESGVQVDIPVSVEKLGRKFSSVRASFVQANETKVLFLGTFGSLQDFNGSSFNRLSTGYESMPKIGECPVDLTDGVDHFGTLPRRIILKLPKNSPIVTGFSQNKFGGKCLIEGHGGFKDGRPACLRSLGFFVDAFPPPLMNYELTRWVPTIELNVQFFKRPQNVNDLLPVRFYNEFMNNGLSSTQGEVYDSDGTLLAVSRQLCMATVKG